MFCIIPVHAIIHAAVQYITLQQVGRLCVNKEERVGERSCYQISIIWVDHTSSIANMIANTTPYALGSNARRKLPNNPNRFMETDHLCLPLTTCECSLMSAKSAVHYFRFRGISLYGEVAKQLTKGWISPANYPSQRCSACFLRRIHTENKVACNKKCEADCGQLLFRMAG